VPDGVVAEHDGKVVVRAGNKLALYDRELAALKEIDTAGDESNRSLFAVFSSPSGRFLLLEFGPGSKMDYRWIDADNLKTLHSFWEVFPPSLSPTKR
jgi:hypothetical protein